MSVKSSDIPASYATRSKDQDRRLREEDALLNMMLQANAPRPIRAPALPVNQFAALLTWLAGVGTTYLFVRVSLDAPMWLCIMIAIITQAILTLAERPTLRGRPSLVSAGALALDTLLNAGGLFGPMQRLGDTPPGAMIAAVTGQAGVTPLAALAVALALGALIAALPEWFWRQR